MNVQDGGGVRAAEGCAVPMNKGNRMTESCDHPQENLGNIYSFRWTVLKS